MDVPFRSHMSIDFLIFVELIVFTGVIRFKQPNSGLLLGIIWAAYLSAVIIKVTFYVTLHPWADILKSDIKSWKWKKSLDEPQIALVKVSFSQKVLEKCQNTKNTNLMFYKELNMKEYQYSISGMYRRQKFQENIRIVCLVF